VPQRELRLAQRGLELARRGPGLRQHRDGELGRLPRLEDRDGRARADDRAAAIDCEHVDEEGPAGRECRDESAGGRHEELVDRDLALDEELARAGVDDRGEVGGERRRRFPRERDLELSVVVGERLGGAGRCQCDEREDRCPHGRAPCTGDAGRGGREAA
jgi:hypothetical protein